MEINLSKKSIVRILLFAILVLVFAAGIYVIISSDVLNQWIRHSDQAVNPSVDEPALQSVTAMYSPSGNQVEWEAKVYEGMTEHGCQLFQRMYANVMWKGLQDKTASVNFLKTADTLQDGSQIWKVSVMISDTSTPVYVHVTQNTDGHWLLDRVLFAQEAAKYEDK